MKNIHILPTPNPSRLWINNLLQGKLELSKEILVGSNTAQNIYITSDEEIKEGDYCISKINNKIFKKEKKDIIDDLCKKIILTTDQDLIKDGVQAIDNTFLEWFVKNPSCEEVEVYEEWNEERIINGKDIGDYSYKIIIPKEEPTEEAKQRAANYMALKGALEAKQETLEEAAENHLQKWRLLNNIHLSNILHAERCKNDFSEGAKWQQERICDSEVIQRIRASKSDAEARRIIRTI
jgi:hypothetical protein